MTVTNDTAKTSALPGDGATFSFAFSPLVIYAADELIVIKTTVATGVEEVIARGTGSNAYSVTVATFPGTGNITFPADSVTPMTSSFTLTIKKDLDYEQQTDLGNQLDYNPDTIEEQFDKIVGLLVSQAETLARCIKVPLTYTSLIDGDLEEFLVSDTGGYIQLTTSGTKFQLGEQSVTDGDASDVTPTEVDETAASSGSGTEFSRDDHRHAVSSNIPKKDAENVFTESMVWKKGSDVVCANALTLGAGNWFDITTGTNVLTSITSIGVGTVIILQFDVAVQIVHNSTDMVCPNGVDIFAEVGDIVGLYEYASDDWRVMFVMNNLDNKKTKSVDLLKKVTFIDDFIGTIKSAISSTAGSGGQNAAATIAAGAGGRVTMATDDDIDVDTHAAVCSSLTLDTLDWRADQGELVMETRLKIDDVSEAVIFIGFTDVISTTVELPIFKTTGADTLDSDASNAVGVGYDVDGTTDQWFHGGVKATVDTAAVHSGTAPANGVFVTVRVEVSGAGVVEGFIDGVSIGTATAAAVTTGTPLTPCIVIGNRTANQIVLTIDYIWVQANR